MNGIYLLDGLYIVNRVNWVDRVNSIDKVYLVEYIECSILSRILGEVQFSAIYSI